LQPTREGRGRIHLLDASRLVHEAPKVYATFLLWLLAELFEQLPERGDADKPLLARFSTRRICCLPTRPRLCKSAWNKWCG